MIQPTTGDFRRRFARDFPFDVPGTSGDQLFARPTGPSLQLRFLGPSVDGQLFGKDWNNAFYRPYTFAAAPTPDTSTETHIQIGSTAATSALAFAQAVNRARQYLQAVLEADRVTVTLYLGTGDTVGQFQDLRGYCPFLQFIGGAYPGQQLVNTGYPGYRFPTSGPAISAGVGDSVPYVPDPAKIQDGDIQNALDDALAMINENLFADQASYTAAYLQLAAHFLVVNLRQSAEGIAGGVPWLVQSKSVGPVSISYGIPQQILDSPLYASLATTPYGLRYLSSVVSLLAGNVAVVGGATLP